MQAINQKHASHQTKMQVIDPKKKNASHIQKVQVINLKMQIIYQGNGT